MEKEFFYIGHYLDWAGKYILKPGTTNDIKRRTAEHNRAYRKTPNHRMMEDTEFVMDWYIPLSKYNTLRLEDNVKAMLKELGVGEYIRNDRFVCDEKPISISVKVRKTYEVIL